MQGYWDLAEKPVWNARKDELQGVSRVIGGEPYKIVIACNGFKPMSATADGATAAVTPCPGTAGLAQLIVKCPQNTDVRWRVRFER